MRLQNCTIFLFHYSDCVNLIRLYLCGIYLHKLGSLCASFGWHVCASKMQLSSPKGLQILSVLSRLPVDVDSLFIVAPMFLPFALVLLYSNLVFWLVLQLSR